MNEKGRISTFQMGMMMYLMVGGTSLLIAPSITGKYAGRDMWISPILGSFSGVLVVWITWKLYQFFPKESIVGSSEKILGRTLGKILTFPFLFFLLHNVDIITREYGEFVTGAFLHKTPLVVVMGSITLVCAFAVRGGIEVVARCTQIFLPLVILFSLTMIILAIPDVDPKNMFPLLENGWLPIIKSSVTPNIWFVDFVYLTFLFPLLGSRRRALSRSMVSVLALMVTMVIANMTCLLVLGNLTEKFTFPVYTTGRYISIADFLEHLDALILAIWIGGGFIQISMWYYVLVQGTARWLNLSNYRPLVFPVGFLMVLISIWVIPNLQELLHFLSTTYPPYSFIIEAAYPIFLLFVVMIRKQTLEKK